MRYSQQAVQLIGPLQGVLRVQYSNTPYSNTPMLQYSILQYSPMPPAEANTPYSMRSRGAEYSNTPILRGVLYSMQGVQTSTCKTVHCGVAAESAEYSSPIARTRSTDPTPQRHKRWKRSRSSPCRPL